MKTTKIYRKIYGALTILMCFCLITSCDLDVFPTNDLIDEDVYKDFTGYKQSLAKVYGAYAMPAHTSASGDYDIQMGDGAVSDFLRAFYNLQCLTTEEVICTWSDDGIPDLNYMTWSSNNPFIAGLYYRSMYQILLVNEFLRESTPDKLSSRGITGADATEVGYFREEARFIRAFQYWVLMDIFGNPPFIDENSPVGKYMPPQIKRNELFTYIETELNAIKETLKDPRTNEYGRADKAACWALMARMYLNAEVYTGTPRYNDAITYAEKVIGSGYTLKGNYEHLFLADNNLNNPEVILSINYDGQKTQGYGGLTYIINAAFITTREDVEGVNFQDLYGLYGQGGWFGNRSRQELPARFNDNDKRKLFVGGKASVDEVGKFMDGLGVTKFRNVTSTGEAGSNANNFLVDTDFPLFRLAEMYLIYAESVLRGGTNGSMSNALTYMNKLRNRAFGSDAYNYTNSTLTLDEILDERSRELYWECFRRTDLIRYGQYTSSNNLWQWKGGAKDGVEVSSYYNLFPLPAADVMANTNLIQNDGY